MNNEEQIRSRATIFGWIRNNLIASISYALILTIFLILFIENFMYSSSAGVIMFREVDDLAFQVSLQHIRDAVSSGHLSMALSTVDYGYGNIFWLPLGLVSVPLEYLRIHFGVDWPLIVFPRQLSLMFIAGTSIVLRKLVRDFGSSEKNAAFVVLAFVSFPFAGYFSMRFGTVSEVVFFATLAIYLAFRFWKGTTRHWWPAVLSLSVAIAVKLTAGFVLPIVGTLLIVGIFNRRRSRPFLALAGALALFVLTLLFLIDPMLVLRVGDATYLHSYVDTMHTFIAVTQQGAANANDPISLTNRVFGTSLFALAALLLYVGLILRFVKERENRWFFGLSAFNIALVAIYLLVAVRAEGSAAVYFTVCLPILAIGILGFQEIEKRAVRVGLIVAIFLALLVDNSYRLVLQHDGIQYTNSFSATSYFSKRIGDKARLDTASTLAEVLTSGKNSFDSSVVLDYTAPIPFNSLTNPNSCFTYLFDNFQDASLTCGYPPDFIVLDSQRNGSLSDSEFDEFMNGLPLERRATALRDRETRRTLIDGGEFAGIKYKEISQFDGFEVFQRI